MKTKEISFFEKKCMFEERIKPQELYEIAKKMFLDILNYLQNIELIFLF